MQKIQKDTPAKMPIFALTRLMRHPELGVREKPLRKVLIGFEGYRNATEEEKQKIEKNSFSKIKLLLEAEYGAQEAEFEYITKKMKEAKTEIYRLEKEINKETIEFLSYGTDSPYLKNVHELKKLAQDVLVAEIKYLDKKEKRELKLLSMEEKLLKMQILQNVPDEKTRLFYGLICSDVLMVSIDAMLIAGVPYAIQGSYPQWIFIAPLALLNASLAVLTYISIKKDLPKVKELAGKLYRAMKRAVEEKY